MIVPASHPVAVGMKSVKKLSIYSNASSRPFKCTGEVVKAAVSNVIAV